MNGLNINGTNIYVDDTTLLVNEDLQKIFDVVKSAS